MNFQIGDRVKVISLSKLEELSPKPWDHYPFISKEGCAFTTDMLEFCGLIGTIIDMWFIFDGTARYRLSFDNGRTPSQSWVPDFFETRFVDSFEEV